MNAKQTIARTRPTDTHVVGTVCLIPLLTMITLLALLAAGGCETPSDTDDPTKKPLPPMPVGKITPLPATGPSTIGQVIIDQIYIPRSTRLDPILAEINERGFGEGVDDQQRAAWNANEIHAIRLSAVELSQFYKAIDQGSSMRRNRHAITKHDLLLETTPELKHAVSIDWAAKPNLDQSLRLPAGRTRFLGRVSFEHDDPKVTLTPQHHWVHQTLIPRPPLEKVRDGRVFDELTLSADLPANTYLVIFWNRSDDSDAKPKEEKPKDDKPEDNLPNNQLPVHREDDNQDQQANNAQAEGPNAGRANAGNDVIDIDQLGTVQPVPPATQDDQPDAQADEPKESPFKFELPPALPRLGRLLLTGERANKPLQLVLVIHSPIQMQRSDDLRTPGTSPESPKQDSPKPESLKAPPAPPSPPAGEPSRR